MQRWAETTFSWVRILAVSKVELSPELIRLWGSVPARGPGCPPFWGTGSRGTLPEGEPRSTQHINL